jgi:VanZ family protein
MGEGGAVSEGPTGTGGAARVRIPPAPLPLGRNAVFLVLWWLAIFTVSSLPNLQPPGAFQGRDKLAHAVEYSVFGYLLGSAFWESPRPRTRRRLVFALLVGIAYGSVDELYQSLVPGRVTSLADLGADSVGILLGVASAWRATAPVVSPDRKNHPRREERPPS